MPLRFRAPGSIGVREMWNSWHCATRKVIQPSTLPWVQQTTTGQTSSVSWNNQRVLPTACGSKRLSTIPTWQIGSLQPNSPSSSNTGCMGVSMPSGTGIDMNGKHVGPSMPMAVQSWRTTLVSASWSPKLHWAGGQRRCLAAPRLTGNCCWKSLLRVKKPKQQQQSSDNHEWRHTWQERLVRSKSSPMYCSVQKCSGWGLPSARQHCRAAYKVQFCLLSPSKEWREGAKLSLRLSQRAERPELRRVWGGQGEDQSHPLYEEKR